MSTLEYAHKGKTFITADTHFGHTDACKLFDRPFEGLEEMEDALVERMNAIIGPDDLLYHLGDFVGEMDSAKERIDCAKRIRSRLNVGKIILLRGNHDPSKEKYDDVFDEVHEILSVKGWRGGNHRVVLCHYPMRIWQGNRKGSLHLYGHAHGRLEEIGRSTDVGVDCWEFAPVEIDFVLQMLADREVVAMPARRAKIQPMRAGT